MKSTVLQYLQGNPYYPCTLLVSPEVALLEGAATALAQDAAWPLVSVGEALADELLTEPPARWPRAAQRAIRQFVTGVRNPVVLYRIDIMFEPQLRLDPLVTFRETSRAIPLVVAWPGHYDGGILTYATPEHAHYRTWRDPQVGILPLHP